MNHLKTLFTPVMPSGAAPQALVGRRGDYGMFRLSALQLNHDFPGAATHPDPETCNWILSDKTLSGVLREIANDIVRLEAMGGGVGIAAWPASILASLDLGITERPAGVVASAAFLWRFFTRALSLRARCERACCAVVRDRRRAAVS